MKTSTLQSLSRRVKNALAAIHEGIRDEACQLTGNDEFDKPTYSFLSRLQRERMKMEGLQRELKRELKATCREEQAIRVLSKAGIYNILVTDLDNSNMDYDF